jgi:hypothetical protein
MHIKAEKHIDSIKDEKTIALNKSTNDGYKPGQRFRKPAIYRSVGIRIPGNDSLMVVHVKEY